MTEAIKWALLVLGMIAMIALLLAIPLFEAIDISSISSVVSQFTAVIAPHIGFARGLINYLLLPPVIPVLSAVLIYVLTKPFVIGAIHLTKGIYSWIFK